MERMKLWLLPVYTVIGFLAIVLLMPSSRWVVLNQFDILAGRWHIAQQTNGYTPNSELQPRLRGLEDSPPAKDQTGRFLQLISMNSWVEYAPDSNAYDQKFRELDQICRAKSDVRYWAQFVRGTAQQATVVPTDPKSRSGADLVQVDHRLIQEMLVGACNSAINLQPDNAFFRIILSGALLRLGEASAARKAFLVASACTRYDDYAWFEAELKYQYLVDCYGYRGERLRTYILLTTMYPHIPVILSLCKHYSVENDPQARSATAQISDLMMSQGHTVIEKLVGRNILNLALAPSRKGAYYRELSTDDLNKDAKGLLMAAPTTRNIPDMVDRYRTITTRFDQYRITSDINDLALNLQPAASACSLVALLLLPLALVYGWLKTNYPRFAAASPYLIWFLAYLSDPIFGPWAAIGTGLGFTWLLFFPALANGIRHRVDMVGIAIAGLSLVMSFWVYPLAMPALMFLCCLTLERKFTTIRIGWTIPCVILACVMTSIWWVEMAIRLHGLDGVLFGTIAWIGLFSAIPIKAPVRWQVLAGASCGILGLVFGTMIYKDIAADKQIAIINRELKTAADKYS